MVLNNTTITMGDGGIANQGIGALFFHASDGSSGDTVFNFNNVVLDNVAFWDLNQVGEGGGTVKTNININNGQGCAQFISQKVNL